MSLLVFMFTEQMNMNYDFPLYPLFIHDLTNLIKHIKILKQSPQSRLSLKEVIAIIGGFLFKAGLVISLRLNAFSI